MLSHGVLPWAKYFLIATPERLYLWKQERPNLAEVAPEVTIDATKEFQPYFQKLHQEPSDIGPEAFELLVLTWLTDIARAGATPREFVCRCFSHPVTPKEPPCHR